MTETLDEIYPVTEAKYMKAEDFPQPRSLKIVAVKVEKVKDAKKVVLSFEGEAKTMIVNATNMKSLRKRFGDDYMTAWTQKIVMFASVDCDYQGKASKGIRVVG